MDYKYIEQLLERYWEAATTAEEERILRAFFAQDILPAHLARYKELFAYQSEAAGESLGAKFDERVLARIGDPAAQPQIVVKAHRITLANRLRPLFRAAAAVAIVCLLGTAAQHSFDNENVEGMPAASQQTYQAQQENLPEDAERAGFYKEAGPKTAAADSLRKQAAE